MRLCIVKAGLLAQNKVITNKENSTNMKLVDSIKESYNELVHKVSWPTRKELVQSAVLVLVASLVLALIVWLIDLSFEKIMQLIYGLF
jgi:preprotein translocase subunit SecE